MNDKTKLFGASERRTLSLAAIRRQDGTQVREALDADAVKDYAERYREGETLPPVDVFEDPQSKLLRLANGFHRCKAADVAPLDEIEAHVYQGDLRAARLFAATCNAEHGVRRTEETVRTAVLTFLKDEECGAWTDRRIAAAVSCSPTTVGKHRAKLEAAAEEAAQRGQQQGLFGEESPAPAPPKKPKRKAADGREIDPEKASRAKLEERIAAAHKEAERCGRVDAADAPRSRHEVMKAIKEAVGVDVPDHAQVGIYRAYEEARLLEQRERARTAAEAQAQPTTYQPILGGDAAEALGGKPLRTAADVRIAELEAEIAELKERLEETEAAADDQAAALGEGVETFKHNQARIAELERDLRNAEARLRKEQEVNTALLTAITRTAALWRGEHDGPRAQLLALLEEQGQQDAAAQWDRALQRAAELGRQESAALVADLQRQLGEAKGRENMVRRDGDRLADEVAALVKRRVIDSRSPAADALLDYRDPPGTPRSDRLAAVEVERDAAREDARLLRLQVQELEQDAAARRQRARQVLCEEPDCTRYVDPPPGGGLALCEAHRPGAALRHWQEVYPLSASAPELLKCPKTWEDLGAALVMCMAGWGGDMLADAETLAAAAIEKGLDVEEVNLRADLRPAELAALLRGVERELKTPTSGPWSAEGLDDSEPPRGKGPCATRCLARDPRYRYCTRDLGHDGRHRYEEPDDDESREKIEKVLARRQAQAAPEPAAPKGRKARAPKAEPAPAFESAPIPEWQCGSPSASGRRCERSEGDCPEAELPQAPGLRWERRGNRWVGCADKTVELAQAFAPGDYIVTGYGCPYRVSRIEGQTLRVVDPRRPTRNDDGFINDHVALAPGLARPRTFVPEVDPRTPIAIPIPDQFVVRVSAEELEPILAKKTLEEWGGDWGNEKAAIRQLAHEALARWVAAPQAQAEPPPPPAAAPTWLPASIGGAGGGAAPRAGAAAARPAAGAVPG